MTIPGNRIILAGLLFLSACASDEGPHAPQRLQAVATAEMVLGPNGTYGYGSTVVLTIRLTNPYDTAWVHVADEADGPVGAILYEDDARTTVVQEVFTAASYLDAGLGRLATETAIVVEGSGASQTLNSNTQLRNFSTESVSIHYGACDTQLRGYTSADRTGAPAWETSIGACGLRGYSDLIEPEAVSSDPFRSQPRFVDALLGPAPRQRYYVTVLMNLNNVKIERPAGEVDFTPP